MSFAPTDKHILIFLTLQESTPLQYIESTDRPTSSPATLPQPQPSVEWQHMLQQQPPWASRLLAHIYYDNLPQVVTDIQDSELLLIVSDGSTRCNRMTYGWVLYTQAGKRLVKGHGSCPGRPNSL